MCSVRNVDDCPGGDDPMYAVLIEVDVAGVDQEQGLAMLRGHIVPAVQQLSGFKSGTWLPGNEAGLGLSLTLWESEADARGMVAQFGPESDSPVAATVRRCEVREVAATA
jgi:hypothetical protein